jgi:hypothetical protein
MCGFYSVVVSLEQRPTDIKGLLYSNIGADHSCPNLLYTKFFLRDALVPHVGKLLQPNWIVEQKQGCILLTY